MPLEDEFSNDEGLKDKSLLLDEREEKTDIKLGEYTLIQIAQLPFNLSIKNFEEGIMNMVRDFKDD